jgi:hypothetical protein
MAPSASATSGLKNCPRNSLRKSVTLAEEAGSLECSAAAPLSQCGPESATAVAHSKTGWNPLSLHPICDHQTSCSRYSRERSAKHETHVAESNSVPGDWPDLGYVALAADAHSPKRFISGADDLGFLSRLLFRLLCAREICRSPIQICRSDIPGSLHFPLAQDIFEMMFNSFPPTHYCSLVDGFTPV